MKWFPDSSRCSLELSWVAWDEMNHIPFSMAFVRYRWVCKNNADIAQSKGKEREREY